MNTTYLEYNTILGNDIAHHNETDSSFTELWISTAGIEFEVNTFQVRQLRILCVADLFQVFTTRTEMILQEEKPRLASILYTRDSSAAGGKFFPFFFLENYSFF